MRKRKWTDDLFIKAVETSLSYAEAKAAGAVKRKISKLNLDTSHMTGMGWN